jgi:hypothetical protein
MILELIPVHLIRSVVSNVAVTVENITVIVMSVEAYIFGEDAWSLYGSERKIFNPTDRGLSRTHIQERRSID